MRNDPIICSMEVLYENAKAGGVATAQQQELILAYGKVLIRRRHERLMQWQDEIDEIKIALAGRARPIFGFVITEKESCEEEVQSIKRADATLRGSINGAVALIGG